MMMIIFILVSIFRCIVGSYSRLENAFLLAIDIGAPDLFMVLTVIFSCKIFFLLCFRDLVVIALICSKCPLLSLRHVNCYICHENAPRSFV